ncbi:hypothetical protein JXC34_04610, partial [Candidatus Woesearchaeota archaeon]|nr:hypothetical protein [Candidatus Woesearchaeota archaeon]
MTFLPDLYGKNSSTKDKIISIVAVNPGINTKKINNTLKKQYSLNVTYQAVHKTLKQMVEMGIISNLGRGYHINQSWISQLRQFISSFDSPDKSEDKINYKKLFDL